MDVVPNAALQSQPAHPHPGGFARANQRKPATLPRAGSLIHSGVSVRGFYLLHVLGASVPFASGIVLFGWRAAACVLVVVASAAVALVIWRSIGARGRQIQPAQTLWMAVLLGMMMPPHLASNVSPPGDHQSPASPPWLLLVAAGLLLVIVLWLLGGVGSGRLHATLYTYLALFVLFGGLLTPHWVLSRKHLASGDLLRAPEPPPVPSASPRPWLERLAAPQTDAFWSVQASDSLIAYTRGEQLRDRARMPLHEMLRDRMPPLEDLVIGGQPAAVGCASAIAVIVGGLFLLYRGLIDFRIPLLIVAAAYVSLVLLPVPTVITEKGAFFRWILPRQPDVMWEQAITFANYELTATPALFMAFFLATAPGIRPLGRRARAIYAIFIGVATAAAQLYVSAVVGPYLALALVAFAAPALDRWFSPRTLV